CPLKGTVLMQLHYATQTAPALVPHRKNPNQKYMHIDAIKCITLHTSQYHQFHDRKSLKSH
ncbi:hypothetical protein ACOQWH_003508, partial [Cronobacter turicensis]